MRVREIGFERGAIFCHCSGGEPLRCRDTLIPNNAKGGSHGEHDGRIKFGANYLETAETTEQCRIVLNSKDEVLCECVGSSFRVIFLIEKEDFEI